MREFLFYLIAAPLFFVLLVSPVRAQNQSTLPNAGITPDSPLFFLDTLGETLQEFFTFNPEGKARLQITFAAERISEIQVILETKGIDARGLDVAKSRLQTHLAKIATILEGQKVQGKDVSVLAKSISDDFDAQKSALEQIFEEQEETLEAKEKELKAKIREARSTGNTAGVEALVKQLAEVKAQKELLELKEEEQEEALEEEEERLEKQLEAKEEALKAIQEAEKERAEVAEEAQEEDIAVPANVFGKFDSLLAQAKAAFDAGNYDEAKRLAKQAEEGLEEAEEAIEDLEAAKEKEEELREEQKEAEEKRLEKLREEQEEIEEEQREAEERLREAAEED